MKKGLRINGGIKADPIRLPNKALLAVFIFLLDPAIPFCQANQAVT